MFHFSRFFFFSSILVVAFTISCSEKAKTPRPTTPILVAEAPDLNAVKQMAKDNVIVINSWEQVSPYINYYYTKDRLEKVKDASIRILSPEDFQDQRKQAGGSEGSQAKGFREKKGDSVTINIESGLTFQQFIDLFNHEWGHTYQIDNKEITAETNEIYMYFQEYLKSPEIAQTHFDNVFEIPPIAFSQWNDYDIASYAAWLYLDENKGDLEKTLKQLTDISVDDLEAKVQKSFKDPNKTHVEIIHLLEKNLLEYDILASLSSTASVTKEWYHEGLIRAAKLFLGYQQNAKQELAETKADYYRILEEYLANKSYTNSDLQYEVYTELLNYHVLKASEAADPTAEYEAILTLSNKYPNDDYPQIDDNILAIIYSLADGYYQAKNSAKLVETSELLLAYTKYLGQNESLRLYIPIIFYMTAEVLLCTDSNKDDANYWLNKIQEFSCDSASTPEVDTSVCQGTYEPSLTESSKAYLGNTQLLLENDTSTVTVNVCQQ